MRLLTAAEMRAADSAAINFYGIPGIVLMENAGKALAEEAADMAGGLRGKKFIIVAGSGNNGGDGFVAARHLLQGGAQVRIFLTSQPEDFKGDALTNWNILLKMGLYGQVLEDERRLNILKIAMLQGDLLLDCVFGTGLNAAVRGIALRLFELINESDIPVLACDIPSGLSADTGKPQGVAVKADKTLSFAQAKLGLILPQAREYVGELQVVDISLPLDMEEIEQVPRQLVDADFCRSCLKPRRFDGHKGNYGHILLVAGSLALPGAAILAAKGALRSGAGLLTAALPQQIRGAFNSCLPEAMLMQVSKNKEGLLAMESTEEIINFKADVALVGPGLGRGDETASLVREVVRRFPAQIVLDADGLNAFAGSPQLLKNTVKPLVITPHPGELARLAGVSVEQIQEDRIEAALTYAREWGVVLVLKGAGTLIADPDGRLFVNSSGNPGMATGGSGDVLGGVIASLLAQGLSPLNAAACGVWLHGRAADLAVNDGSRASLLAGDIAAYLPFVFQELSQEL